MSVAVRYAPPLDSYPPIRRSATDTRALVRLEPCACGGSIAQWRDESIAPVVAAHNATIAHRTWRQGASNG